MNRSFRTLIQSLVSPVLSTILYFIVFGAAIGSRMENISNVSYGAFIVPGLIMLTVQMQSVNNASFGIYFPKFIGTTYELLSAPLSFVEIVIGYVGAATTKAFSIGLIILATSYLFVNIDIVHPIFMLFFLLLTCISFSLLGFIIGIVSDKFEQLNISLEDLATTVIKKPKLQETSTLTLVKCFINNDNFEICNKEAKKEIIPILIRRLALPAYMPVLCLICSFLLLKNQNVFLIKEIFKILFL